MPSLEPAPNSRDSFVATIVATVALAGVLVEAGGGGRLLELLLVGAGVVAAYATDWAPPRLVVLVVAAGYLAVELGEDRLSYDHYWTHILAVGLAGVAVFGAATVRLRRVAHRQGFERALEAIDESRYDDQVQRLLAGGRPLSALERELLRSKRHAHAAAMLLVRPDGIDDIALRHGPDGVREVLRVVAETIGRQSRTSDDAYRHGPFDICVLLPETGLAGARVAAERFRLEIAGRRILFGPGDALDLSVSIGAAVFPVATSEEELHASARDALERALELGGNRTVLSSLPEDAPRGWALEAPPGPETAGLGVPRSRDSI